MGISLRTEHFKRYRDIAKLMWKYGRSDLVRQAGLEDALEPESHNGDLEAHAHKGPDPTELASDLERMGPAFVKLGQMLSTRADLLPAAYLTALSRLQDDVEPIPHAEVVAMVERELGRDPCELFAEFDSQPLAAASLGQVHRARLLDGRPVAVKVQRPLVREQVAEDLAVLQESAAFLERHNARARRYGVVELVDELRKSLLEELDYRAEANHLCVLGRNLEEFERIVVPEPIPELSSERVLTMDYIRGRKVSPLALLARRQADGRELAEELFRAYLKQVLVDGFFHADPHPGNVFLTDDGKLALLDLGMVARVTPGMQEHMLLWLLAVSEGRAEDAAEINLKMGKPREEPDAPEFKRRTAELIARSSENTIEGMHVGRIALEVTRISAECGIRMPRELTMLGKTLLNLDHVARVLDPEFEPNAAVRRYATRITRERMLKSMSAGNLMRSLLEVKDFAERLPGRANQILEKLANNELRFEVDTIDETELVTGLQKIANRITLGLVLAALIIAAALLMRVPTSFNILGYPGFAILLFLLAAGGGIGLVIQILAHDRKRHG